MKPIDRPESCEMLIPEPLLRAAFAAEQRALGALDRLEVKLDMDGKTAQLEDLIDADKAALEARGR